MPWLLKRTLTPAEFETVPKKEKNGDTTCVDGGLVGGKHRLLSSFTNNPG